MYSIRPATPQDAAIITHHRRQMFVDMGYKDNLEPMLLRFTPWVSEGLAVGTYLGWLVEHQGQVIAGLGLLFTQMPPRPQDLGTVRPYYLQHLHRARSPPPGLGPKNA